MNPLDKIIQIIRENMVANAPGTSGGYTSKGEPTTVAGFDPVMDGRTKVMRRLPKEYSKFLRKNKKR
jgi:hypothetical protein